MFIKEEYVDATNNYIIGDSDIYKPFTDNVGELYKSLQKEYGRCVGKVYVDPDAQPVGWVFVKRVPYEDAQNKKENTYLHEVWVTLYDATDTVVTTKHYHKI